MGSISKPMEAVILIQLSAEGRVDLDRRIQHYLPGLLPEDRFAEPISVRQLLDHTSGLPQDFEGSPAASADEAIERRLEYLSFDEVIEKTLRAVGSTGPARGTACFSVGLMSVPLPDGSVLWGKTGSEPGYRSGVFASPDLNRRAV